MWRAGTSTADFEMDCEIPDTLDLQRISGGQEVESVLGEVGIAACASETVTLKFEC